MSSMLLVSVFSASLVGSLHCGAMCGPLAGIAAGFGQDGSNASAAYNLSTYNLGRLLGYTMLGALGGALGQSIDWVSGAAGLSPLAATLAALMMILWALAHLSQLSPRFSPRFTGPLSQRFRQALARIHRLPPRLRAPLLGMATGALPCGWLYAFVLVAAGSGSIALGATLMAAFWLGTLPVLLGLSAATRLLGTRLTRQLPAVGAVVLLVLGFGTLFQRYNIPTTALRSLGTPVGLEPLESSANAHANGASGRPSCH